MAVYRIYQVMVGIHGLRFVDFLASFLVKGERKWTILILKFVYKHKDLYSTIQILEWLDKQFELII
jgi:hypothetical protein